MRERMDERKKREKRRGEGRRGGIEKEERRRIEEKMQKDWRRRVVLTRQPVRSAQHGKRRHEWTSKAGKAKQGEPS